MKCPLCQVLLHRVPYEGLTIQECPQCHGHLVGIERAEIIRGRRGKTKEELMAEVLAASGIDTLAKIKCPKCFRIMEKFKLDPPADFFYDVCGNCESIWYDGGELARLKLTYQISEQGKEAAELQRRIREMTPERRAQFEANLAALPDAEDEVEGLLKAAFEARENPLSNL